MQKRRITDGLVRIPNIPVYLRNKIRTFQKRIGQDKFYQKLIKLDSLAKDKINSNDVQRSIRAYEVKKYTKISLIEWFKKTNKNFENNDFLKIYIDFPRPELIKRINRRVEEMFKEGAINEIKKFLKLNVKKDKSSNKIIGIKEIDKYLKGDLDLKATKEIMAIKTRQYAKRQSTWARGQMLGWQKIDYKDLVSFLKKI